MSETSDTSNEKTKTSSSCITLCPEKPSGTCKKSFGSNLKEFLLQGNAIDLAIGLVIGAAFAKLVTSIIDDLIMPAILCIFGDFSLQDNFFICRKREYDSIIALEAAGILPPNHTYETIEEVKAAGIDITIRVDSLEQAREIGLNTINWGNFIQIFINFLVLAFILAGIIFAFQKLRCSITKENTIL